MNRNERVSNLTFNQRVPGSSPGALTIEIKELDNPAGAQAGCPAIAARPDAYLDMLDNPHGGDVPGAALSRQPGAWL